MTSFVRSMGAPRLGLRREKASVSKRETVLFGLFVTMIVMTGFPGKFLFYFAPFLLLIGSIVVGRFISLWRLLAIVAVVVALSGFAMIADATGSARVSVPALLVGVIDYLPLFLLWSVSRDFEVTENFARRLADVCVVFIWVQALVGVVQFVVSGDGDFVSGTLGLFDFVTGDKTISQVNFNFTLFCMIVYCAMWFPSRRMLIAAAAALIACAIAQSGHQTIFFVLLVPLLAITGHQPLRTFTAALLGAAVLFAALMLVAPDTLDVAQGWADKVLFSDSSLKRTIVLGAIDVLSEPKNFIFGVGLGQFSSRAAQIVAGVGTSVPIPSFLMDSSSYFDRYMVPVIALYKIYGEDSAMAMPYFSVLSIVTELGVPFALGFFLMSAYAVVRNLRRGRSSPAAWRMAYYCNFFIGFLFLCCFIQNYLELTQAIFVPVLLYIVSAARLKALARESEVSDIRQHSARRIEVKKLP